VIQKKQKWPSRFIISTPNQKNKPLKLKQEFKQLRSQGPERKLRKEQQQKEVQGKFYKNPGGSQ